MGLGFQEAAAAGHGLVSERDRPGQILDGSESLVMTSSYTIGQVYLCLTSASLYH